MVGIAVCLRDFPFILKKEEAGQPGGPHQGPADRATHRLAGS